VNGKWKRLTKKRLSKIKDWKKYRFQVLYLEDDRTGFEEMWYDDDILDTIYNYIDDEVYRYKLKN
jgi:hypothetical protein